jgi:molybdopterin-guanine dinucleotide biosynthesis protein A
VAGRALTGVLLVGGASSRFGAPKPLARFGQETLAERGWRTLGELCDECIAVGKVGDGLLLPFPVVDDGSAVRAPIVGVVRAIQSASYDVCVLLPVDCPLVTSGLLGDLADACDDAVDVALPPTGPLPGVYRRGALPVLERAVEAGAYSLRRAIQPLVVVEVDCDRALLANVNEPADLEALLSG